MTEDLVLESPSHATSEWVSTVLGSHVEIVATELIADAGIVSPVARLRLNGDDPATVIVKTAPEDKRWRARVNSIGLMKTEAYFYRDIGNACGLPVPHCWLAEWRASDGHCTIVMEDLDPLVPGDNFAGLAHDRAAHGIELLVSMHSRHWREVDAWPWLAERAAAQQASAEEIGPVIAGVLERYGDRFPNAINEVLPSLPDQIVAAHGRAPRETHTTLVHGDFHAANIAFGPDRSAVKVFDWQLAMAATPAADLIKLLLNALTVEDRRRHSRALLEDYRARMSKEGIDITPRDLGALVHAELLTRVGSSCRVSSRAAPGSFTERWAILCMERMGAALEDGW